MIRVSVRICPRDWPACNLCRCAYVRGIGLGVHDHVASTLDQLIQIVHLLNRSFSARCCLPSMIVGVRMSEGLACVFKLMLS
jgi:hypothetical protein